MLLLLVAGCGGDDAGGADAAAGDGATPDAIVQIPWLAEGAPPVAPPVLTPCPTGWREVADPSGLQACEPWPESGRASCPPGEAHFPGTAGCAPVGAPCPSGDFADDLPSDAPVVYVQPGATGGDGSLSAPYGTFLEFSLARLGRGGTVALSKGAHEGTLRLPAGLTLRGACAVETALSTAIPDDLDGIVAPLGADVIVRDLALGPAPRAGVTCFGEGFAVRLEGVEIRGATHVGIHVQGGTVELERVAIRDTQTRPDGTLGRGIMAIFGGTVVGTTVSVIGSHDGGVFVSDSPEPTSLSDCVVADTHSLPDGNFGRGVTLFEDGLVGLSGCVIEDNLDIGVMADRAGGLLSVERSVIRRTAPSPAGIGDGQSLAIQDGGAATVSRSVLSEAAGLGILVNAEGSELSMEDSLVVRNTANPGVVGSSGSAAAVQYGASMTGRRLVFDANADDVLFLHGEGTHGDFEDLRISNSTGLEPGLGGRPMVVQLGADSSMRRALLVNNTETGVLVHEARLDVEDLAVNGVASTSGSGAFGVGIGVQKAGVFSGGRIVVRDTHEIGVSATVDGASVDVTDLVVEGVSLQRCYPDGCPEGAAAYGLSSSWSATVDVTRFVIGRADTCGVFVAREGSMDLSTGEVTGCEIGACVQVDGYDVARLSTGVAYRDNGTNLQATSLPVPEAAEIDVPDG